MGKALVEIPPGSFLQATETAETALAGLVRRGARQGRKSIADLFCGVGPFALRLAETRQASMPPTATSRRSPRCQKAVNNARGLSRSPPSAATCFASR